MAEQTVTITKKEYKKLKKESEVDRELIEQIKRSLEDLKNKRVSKYDLKAS